MDELKNRQPGCEGSGPIKAVTLELKGQTAETYNALWGPPEDDEERKRRETYINVTFAELERAVVDVMDAVDTYSAEGSAAFLSKLDNPDNGETGGIACQHENLFLIPETIGRAEDMLKLLVEVIDEELAEALPRERGEAKTRWNLRRRTALKQVRRRVLKVNEALNDLLPNADRLLSTS